MTDRHLSRSHALPCSALPMLLCTGRKSCWQTTMRLSLRRAGPGPGLPPCASECHSMRCSTAWVSMATRAPATLVPCTPCVPTHPCRCACTYCSARFRRDLVCMPPHTEHRLFGHWTDCLEGLSPQPNVQGNWQSIEFSSSRMITAIKLFRSCGFTDYYINKMQTNAIKFTS